jgi:galactose mutarotase-like enzyme
MYSVQSYKERTFNIYELRSEKSDSWLKVCPERGGIIIGFGVNGQELLYLNKETFYNNSSNIRGGIPILFPMSGQLSNGQYEWDGNVYSMPNHGFARNLPWKVEEVKCDPQQASLTISLCSTPDTLKMYPFEFDIEYTYILRDNALTINQRYHNKGGTKLPLYVGFHPYFLSKTKEIDIESDATRYYDYNTHTENAFSKVLDLKGLSEAVVLLDASSMELKAKLSDCTITIKADENFKYIMFWTQEDHDFVCIEPWMAKTDEMNRKEELQWIKPGNTLETNVIISAN